MFNMTLSYQEYLFYYDRFNHIVIRDVSKNIYPYKDQLIEKSYSEKELTHITNIDTAYNNLIKKLITTKYSDIVEGYYKNEINSNTDFLKTIINKDEKDKNCIDYCIERITYLIKKDFNLYNKGGLN